MWWKGCPARESKYSFFPNLVRYVVYYVGYNFILEKINFCSFLVVLTVAITKLRNTEDSKSQQWFPQDQETPISSRYWVVLYCLFCVCIGGDPVVSPPWCTHGSKVIFNFNWHVVCWMYFCRWAWANGWGREWSRISLLQTHELTFLSMSSGVILS